MSVVEIKELTKPISADLPCGEELTYDEDFLSIKEKRAHSDDRSLGLWKEKKSPQNIEDEKTIIELCVHILKNKSKSLQVIAFLLEEIVKKDNLSGLVEGLEILNDFCENFWENCHPSTDKETFVEDRAKILRWIDEKTALALRFSVLLSLHVKEQISFDEIEKANKIGFYSKNSNLNSDSTLPTKYQLFLKQAKEDLIQNEILNLIDISLEKINKFRNFLENHLEIDNNFFYNLTFLLNNMSQFFKGIILEKTNQEDKGSPQLNNKQPALQEIFENENLPNESTLPLNAHRDLIYNKINTLAKNLLVLEPHSPVPHFIFKLHSWKDKSFVEIAAELGLNSPMFDFLTTREGAHEKLSDEDD